MAIGPLWLGSIIIASATSILAAALLYIYLRSFRAVRTVFTVGLITFASAVLLQNLIAMYIYFELAQSYPASLATLLIIINAIELVAFAVLLSISLRPT